MSTVSELLSRLLQGVLKPSSLQGLETLLCEVASRDVSQLTPREANLCLDRVKMTLRIYCPDASLAEQSHRCVAEALRQGAPKRAAERPPRLELRDSGLSSASGEPLREVKVAVSSVDDAVQARMAAKDLALRVGFSETNAIKIATAVSELARNIVLYAQQGEIVVRPRYGRTAHERGITIVASDHGPGIADLTAILAGRYKSALGLGLGLRGVQKLMHDFGVDTGPGQGTVVTASMWLA